MYWLGKFEGREHLERDGFQDSRWTVQRRNLIAHTHEVSHLMFVMLPASVSLDSLTIPNASLC